VSSTSPARKTTTHCRILVVVVNYRTPALTVECLRSLAADAATVPGVRCVVVDNASGDDSVPVLESALAENGWGSWITFVRSDKNTGFAGGNNLGIAAGEPAEYVLLLNSDTVVHPGCLKRCLKVMEQDSRIGAMSCRVLNRDGSIQNVARRFPSPERVTCVALGLPWKLPALFSWANLEDPSWDRERVSKDVDWLGGAFLFIRASVFGGHVRLDEDFFFYGEDIAFCHRVHRLGWRCRYDPDNTIIHLGGASSDPSRMPAGDRSVHEWRARYLIQRKCYGRWAESWVRALDLTTTAARLVRAQVQHGGSSSQVDRLKSQLAMIRTVASQL
jgi:N-acetylglucosaminyl-diphospho-decaprenol L-rhamnosyltransferase